MAINTEGRPLSPHLQVWRWHLTMLTSILHRASGGALFVGMIFFCFWLGSIAAGPDAYALAEAFFLSWLGRFILFGFTLAITYHFANGVRHLFWDAGAGFKPAVATFTSVIVMAFSIAATAAIWFAAYALR